MSKKIAIKGDSVRGNEIAELLVMMGGKNIDNIKCQSSYLAYYIDTDDDGKLCGISSHNDDFIVYTLEKFLEKFPYKVGDEFCSPYDKITEMFWDEEDEWVYYKTEKSEGFITALDIMTDSYARSR